MPRPGALTGGLAPVAVWDASQRGWHSWPHWQEAEQWALTRGLADSGRDTPRAATYRIEIWLVDAPFARCYRYSRDPAGAIRFDLAAGRALSAPAEDIRLAELPPRHLRVTALPPPAFPGPP